MKKHVLKRLLSLMLVVALCAGFLIPAGAAGSAGSGSKVTFEKVDNDAVSVSPVERRTVEETQDIAPYADTETVRVSIVLESKSTIEAVGTTEDIAANAAATAYRSKLEQEQASVTAAITSAIGEKLDVVWNITLAANIISANVEYGQIEAIEKVPGVKEVLIETKYEPMVVDTNEAVDPNMATSTIQTGANYAWAAGYTGAGSRIAVIDTGIDTDHQSFSAAGYEYSLMYNAGKAGKTIEEYKASLNLLTEEEIAKALEAGLNLTQKNANVTAADLYVSSKIPFGFNYIDKNLDITHDNDGQGEHGSHVEGIAAANAYIQNADGTFSNALESVGVQGVAPDAQILAMKVFGTGGGAYDSDYMVAIEDAVMLGCDSVNLSLGSGNPGMSRNATEAYQTILENLENSGTVVAMSAGNSGSWVENAYNLGYLYADDVSMQTNGSPGSFTNSLAVASVDNAGFTGNYVSVDGNLVFYTETSGYGNEPMTSISRDDAWDYILIDSVGTDEEFAAVADVLAGKIAVCSRGSTSFYQKANAAVANGAAATIICNNTEGTISMNLTGYEYTAPCVSITQADGAMLKEKAEAVTDDEGNVLYYAGTMTVAAGTATEMNDTGYYTISDFSSWGVPGSLELKPEISAPGGNIYSVNGAVAGGQAYENMSGTSMASPQIAGMTAVVAQYIRENDLETKTGLSVRQLAQSLLMSTAVPMWEEDSASYYPVLRQGAGLANVGAAVSAGSYVLMGEDATASAADGKVKAELGDDPDRTGTYTFSFSVNNLTDEEQTYFLHADLFTQDAFTYTTTDVFGEDSEDAYMDTWARNMADEEYTATFTGDAVMNGCDLIVAANATETVTVTLQLSEAKRAELDSLFENGAYLQGYVFAEQTATAEGVEGTVHSIPVLGFYGNWTDASMYDVGTYLEYLYGEENRVPYLGSAQENLFAINYAGDSSNYVFGGNPLVPDETYMPERNAINNENGDQIGKIYFTPIRNAAASLYWADNLTTNETLAETETGSVYSAYYYVNGGKWQNTSIPLNAKFKAAGASEGDQIEMGLTLVPEYYVAADGSVDYAALGEGATYSMPMVVDNTAPEILDVSVSLSGGTMTVKASDNQYVAAVALYNNAGTEVYAYEGAKQDIAAGATDDYTLDLTGVNGKKFLLQVFDYAMNVTTYKVEMQIGEELPLPEMMAFDLDDNCWISFDSDTEYDTGSTPGLPLLMGSDLTFFAATIVDHIVFATTGEGDLYVMPEDDLSDLAFVANVGDVLTDMAYNKADGEIYAVNGYSKLYTMNKLTGELTYVADMPVVTNTLACDEDGVFYCNEYGTGNVYKFTLESLTNPTNDKRYDFNGDGYVDTADCQALLDYATGARDAIRYEENGDFDESGDITSYDAYLFFQKLNADELLSGAELLCDTGIGSKYVQAMEINPNTGMLCWTSYYTVSFLSWTFGFSYYFEIDTTTGEYTKYNDLWDELSCLIIPEKTSGGDWSAPTDEVIGVTIYGDTDTILRGASTQLSASVLPWTATDRTVIWSSSNEAVATVSADGLVTGVNEGTCEITATSNLDPSVSDTYTITVELLRLTLTGVLQDENGQLQDFAWDMESAQTWTGGQTYSGNIISAEKQSDSTAYAVNSDGDAVMKLDLTTGDSEAVGSAPVPMNDLARSEFSTDEQDLMEAIYYYYYLPAKDPTNVTTSAFGFSSYLSSYTGGSEFVGVTTDGWTTYNGNNAEVVYLLDNAGYIWLLKVYDKGNGSYSAGISFIPTNLLDAGYELTYDSGYNPLSSLIVGDDGYLYFSGFNGDTNVIYRLSYNGSGFDAMAIGDVGSDVWPAVLFEAKENMLPASGAARNALSVEPDAQAQSVNLSAEEMLAAASGRRGAAAAMSAAKTVDNRAKAQSASAASFDAVQAMPNTVSPMSSSEVDDPENTVTLVLTAKDTTDGEDVASTNGIMQVQYDPAALTLDSVTPHTWLSSVVRDTVGGNITFGYVAQEDLEAAPAGTELCTIVFTVKDTSVEGGDVITVVHDEVGSQTLEGVEESITIGYDHYDNTVLKGVKEATCTEDGYTGDLYCLDCGLLLKKGEVIPATGHTEEVRDAKEPTCTEDGYTGDTYCSVCGEKIAEGEVIPATGHGATETRDAKEPTCTEKGYTGDTYCTVCGEKIAEGETIPATGHQYVAVVTEPTYTSQGYTTYTCSCCGDTYISDYVPAKTMPVVTPTAPTTPTLTEDWPFTDVVKGDACYDDVKYVYDEDLMYGTSKTLFSPYSTLTRGMVVTILYRMENEPDVAFAGTFTDVASGLWYSDAVEWAAKCGVVNGYSTGAYGPEDAVTREQLAAILYRYANYKGYATAKSADVSGYTDAANISAYAVDAVKWAVAMDILEPISGKLQPRQNADRAQVAKAIASFHSAYIGK